MATLNKIVFETSQTSNGFTYSFHYYFHWTKDFTFPCLKQF